MKSLVLIGLLAVPVVSVALLACGPSASPVQTANAPGGSKDPSKWPANDRSMCDWKNKPDLEVTETAGPGAGKPNVRRVFKVVGEGESHHNTLICREIDTNLDGVKDVVRTFNLKGEALHEEADTDYDGKTDVWINFVDGRMAEEDEDTNHDGKPDVWKFYVNGQLQRIRRDRNYDGKPDVWEIYAKGRLERVGTDESYDGHVDRWDRDEQLKYEADQAEKKARDELVDGGAAAAAAIATGIDAGAAPSSNAPPSTGGADAGAPAKKPASVKTPKKK